MELSVNTIISLEHIRFWTIVELSVNRIFLQSTFCFGTSGAIGQ